MSLFYSGSYEPTIKNSIRDTAEFERRMIATEAYSLQGEALKEFVAPGGLGEQLVTEAKLNKKTLVRLSKQDDLHRRAKTIAYQLAREAGDPDMKKFDEYRAKALTHEKAVEKKFGIKAMALAKQQQKDYLKDSNKKGLLAAFGAKDR